MNTTCRHIIYLWINTEDSFSTAPEELGTIFATVIPGTIQGTVVMNYNGEDIYSLALSDFDEGRIDRERNIYNIALEVNGDFIFENLRNGDSFRFAFLDKFSVFEYFIVDFICIERYLFFWRR